MSYNNSIPQPGDLLSDSQGQILNNFSKADSSFGTDHYAFSDGTSNNGFHKAVTTPNQAAHPVTVVDIPKLYGMQDTANIGVLQYTRMGNNAVPFPLSAIQSPSGAIALANGASTNLLDFTGLTAGTMFEVFAGNANSGNSIKNHTFCTVLGLGPLTLSVYPSQSEFDLKITASGNILRLTNNSGSAANNIYWSLKFIRIQ